MPAANNWSEIVESTNVKGALPKLPGDQPGGEQISRQCWANPDQVTLSKFYVAFFENTMVGWAEEGFKGETKRTPSGSCGCVVPDELRMTMRDTIFMYL